MKILDIALKDLLRSTRNLFLVGMGLAAPLLLAGLLYFAFGSMTSGDVSMTAIRVGVVDADVLPADSPLEAPLGASIRSMFFDESVQSWISAADYADETAARAALNAQEIGVAIIIPPTFTADYFKDDAHTPVVILQDPTLTIGPTVVRDMVTSLLDGVAGGGVAYRVIGARVEANGQTLDPSSLPNLFERYAAWYADFQRALFHNPQQAALVVETPAANQETANSLQSLVGLALAGQMIFFSFFTGAYAMNSILQESEEGTLARLFTTPTDRTTILAGKFLAVFLTVLLQGLVLLAAGTLIFGIQWGRAGSISLALLGQILAAGGLGVLLVSFIKNSRQAGPIFGGGLTALGMIGGLFTVMVEMPAAFNALGVFTPQGWALRTWKLTLAGQPASELVVPVLVLAAMGAVMFAVGAVVFRRRFE